MNTPTFREQFDKITEAYIKGEIRPYDPSFCFCGTLCDNKYNWFGACQYKHFDYKHYSGEYYLKMEVALLSKVEEVVASEGYLYENKLFEGISASSLLKNVTKYGANPGIIPMQDTDLTRPYMGFNNAATSAGKFIPLVFSLDPSVKAVYNSGATSFQQLNVPTLRIYLSAAGATTDEAVIVHYIWQMLQGHSDTGLMDVYESY